MISPQLYSKINIWPLHWTYIPSYVFILVTIIIFYQAMRYRYSLIPTLGLLLCFYMLSELGLKNWMYFTAWLILGLLIYLIYGYHNSHLKSKTL
ncbi:MAG: amino acid permease C-terminal domain-containing protein [Bacteroidia bacterium]